MNQLFIKNPFCICVLINSICSKNLKFNVNVQLRKENLEAIVNILHNIETVFKFTLAIIIFYVPFTYFFSLLLPMSIKHLNFPLMHCEMNLEPTLRMHKKQPLCQIRGRLVSPSCSSTRLSNM